MREYKSCIRLGLLCLTLSAVIFTPQLVRADQAQERLEQVQQFIRAKRYVQANRLLQSVITSRATSPNTLAKAYMLRGVCLSHKGRKKLAQINFIRSLALQPAVGLNKGQDRATKRSFASAKRKIKKLGAIKLRHAPPASVADFVSEGLQVDLVANPYKMVRSIQIRYTTGLDHKEKVLTQTVNKRSRIPHKVHFNVGKTLNTERVEYYVLALNQFGLRVNQIGSKEEPLVLESEETEVEVQPDLVAQTKQADTSLRANDDHLADAGPMAKAESGGQAEAAQIELVPINSTPETDPDSEMLANTEPQPETTTQPDQQQLAAATALTIRPQMAETITNNPSPFASTMSGPWYKEWWVWTAVGLAVAAGTAATLAFVPERGSPPRSIGTAGATW